MTAANTSSFPRLMGDVGGTNARFALQETPGAQPTQVKTYSVAEYANIDGAMKAYLDQVAGPKPRQGAVGTCRTSEKRARSSVVSARFLLITTITVESASWRNQA